MIRMPDGTTIHPRESIEITADVTIHVERWRIYIEAPEGWLVASADRGDTEGDGIFFDSYDNWVAFQR